MILVAGSPASNKPRITASTTAGRVPLLGPGPEYTLSPITSLGATSDCQEALTSLFPVSLSIPRLTISTTTGDCGSKAIVARESSTITTRAPAGGPTENGGRSVANASRNAARRQRQQRTLLITGKTTA